MTVTREESDRLVACVLQMRANVMQAGQKLREEAEEPAIGQQEVEGVMAIPKRQSRVEKWSRLELDDELEGAQFGRYQLEVAAAIKVVEIDQAEPLVSLRWQLDFRCSW